MVTPERRRFLAAMAKMDECWDFIDRTNLVVGLAVATTLEDASEAFAARMAAWRARNRVVMKR